jgi:predicted glycogen debranching enzyme
MSDAHAPEIGDPSTPEASAFFARLVRATDAFVAVRGGGTRTGPGRRTTVIAGYPWFEDWGRDTFVALPGLFLVTGRHEEALRVLEDYASFIRDGLVPNRFPDQADEPDYNTADASLWLFTAVGAYLAYTGDVETVLERLLGPMRDIAAHYLRGTRFGIRAAADGLLRAGEPGVAVTWMDAKLGDWVVTPRHGYPVELNALWYNALRLLAELDRGEDGAGVSGPTGDDADDGDGGGGGARWRQLASRVRASFNARFWNADKGCLYDVVHDLDSGLPPDAAVRPNQLLAVSLPFPVLDPTRWRSVVEVCFRELFVPFGLRTLSRAHPGYRGLYRGGPAERDGAYHQGTVWPWLLGPFVTALRRALGHTEESRLLAARILRPFERHLREAGIGYISEVFDGDFPHLPGGCIAQAWSVAEILRAYVEEVLDIRPGLAGWGSLPGGQDPADGRDGST